MTDVSSKSRPNSKTVKTQAAISERSAPKRLDVGLPERQPNLTIRSPTALSTVHAGMLNETVIANYFNTLTGLVSSINLEDIQWVMEKAHFLMC